MVYSSVMGTRFATGIEHFEGNGRAQDLGAILAGEA